MSETGVRILTWLIVAILVGAVIIYFGEIIIALLKSILGASNG